ncbi:outer membrane protein [Rhizobium sp. L1K21]|uniref:outer membrane protein n=1 Tax=Rhizobium sp. L1K21 TaxID=2954933 RepID=UPI00209291D3|nr:outer membrane protein [Rhizobium sp. L1K21]MCO6186494.1 porin family protein [Rhizobium sp. L1K21]
MRILTASLTTAAILSMSVAAAQAADAIDTVPQAPEAVDTYIPATSDWSGAYVGLNTGYSWGHFTNGGGRDRGFNFGGYGGYNMQSDNLVYGIEGDLGYSDISANSGGVNTKAGLNGSLRARVGVDASPFLIYGTGGVAAASLKASNAAGSDTKGAIGWTAGVGTEAKITDNITARLEYRYTDYGSRNFNLGGTTVSRGYDENAVKVGIGVKF